MKSIFIPSFFIFFFTTVFAQSPPPGKDNVTDQKAQEILKGVSTKFKSFKSVKATFVINIENPKSQSKDVQTGTIYLKGNKYKLQVAGQDVISDGKTRWTYLKDENEIQIDNQKTDENSITPNNIFTMYEKGWLFKFISEQLEKGMVYQLVELIPVDPKSKSIFKVKLKINKNDKFITSAKMFDKNGNVQTIDVQKITPDVANEDSVYSFNPSKSPGAEIVDLR